MHRTFRRSWVAFAALLVTLILPGAAHADWLADGTVVCIMDPANQMNPQACTDGAGGMIVIWRDERGAEPQVFAQRMLADGTRAWGASGILVCPGNPVTITPLAAGGAFVFSRAPTGVATEFVRAQQLDAAGNVAPGWPAGGRLVATKAPWETWKIVAPVGTTAVDFIADQFDTVNVSIRRLTWNRVGLDGSPPAGWTGPRVLATSSQGWSDFHLDSFARSADGTVWFGYTEILDGGPGPNTYRGYLSAYTSAGVFLSSRLLVSNEAGGTPPIVALGGPANEVFTLSPTLARWTLDGTAVWPSTPSIPFSAQLVVPDGSGGLWFADATHIDHVMPDGSIPPAFGTTGLVLPGPASIAPISATLEGNDLWFARSVGSAPGEVLELDLYVHHILSDGTLPPKWMLSGARASGAPGMQQSAALVPTGDGHALAAWNDNRWAPSVSDVYANVVGPNPLLSVDPPSAPSGLRASLRARLTSRSGLEVSFTAAVPGVVALELVDVTGRRVAGARVAGEASRATSHQFDVGALASGLYFVHARQGEAAAAVRVFLLH